MLCKLIVNNIGNKKIEKFKIINVILLFNLLKLYTIMEHTVTNMDIIINVWVQIINLAIFFFIFYKFLAGPIIEAVEKRKEMLEQFKNAEDILAKKRQEAEEEKKKLIEEGQEHKNKILLEAKQEAEKIKKSILEQAEREKETLLEKAKQQIEAEKKELENEWEKSVKQAAYLVYEKIVQDKDASVIDKYIKSINLK